MAIAIINPATGQLQEEFTPHTAAEVETKIAETQTAFETLRSTTYEQRGEWMQRAADILAIGERVNRSHACP